MRAANPAIGLSLAVLAVAATTPVAGRQNPQEPAAPPQQVFRAGIELLTVDVTALDGEGRQVNDLKPTDFVVEVDGDPRQVVSAEFLALVDPRRPVMTAADKDRARKLAEVVAPDPYFSSNSRGAPPGRLILLLIDQGNVRAGAARPAMEQARKFVDALQPEDRIGVAAVPAPGELLDFTTNHDRVKESLLRVVGTATPNLRRFNVSLTEALAIYQNSDQQLALEVLARECGTALQPSEMERCERALEQDAAEAVAEMRHQSGQSIRAIRELLIGLRAIEGPKHIIMISEGLVLEHLGGDLDDLATLAADARASLDILMLDVMPFDASQSRRPTTPRDDRRLQEEGLEVLAGMARGNLYRIATTTTYAFDRITRALAGYYLVGVEARPTDRDGRRHRISVKTTRRGVSLRSRRTFLAGMSGVGGTPTEAVSRALRSPLPANDLPIRLATWTFKEPGSTRTRLLVALDVERLADQPLDYTTGLALINRNNRGLMPNVEVRKFTPAADPALASYSTAMIVEPGTYRLRVALADSEGRVGSVEREVAAFHVDGSALAVGDLLLGSMPGGDGSIAPAVEPFLAAEPMAALLEAYVPAGTPPTALTGSLDVVREEGDKPIMSLPMRAVQGRGDDIVALQAMVSTGALPPGRYLARATLREGGAARGHLVRPFRVAPGAAAPASGAAEAAVATAAGVPPEFAETLVAGLSPFDQKALLGLPVLNAAYALAEGRGAAAKAAVAEARKGALGAAAMTALEGGDQVSAAFLKGIELLQQGQSSRAAVQFQTAMQQAPQFAPARLYLGITLAAAERHREAAGLLQSSAAGPAPAIVGRTAGEEWLRAGQAALAVNALEPAAARPDADAATRKALAMAYVLANRPGDAVPLLTTHLEQQTGDREALLAGIYALYSRHVGGANADTLAADRGLARRWLQAYATGNAPMQPLATAWVTYLEGLK
jgi:VWFA-related protein